MTRIEDDPFLLAAVKFLPPLTVSIYRTCTAVKVSDKVLQVIIRYGLASETVVIRER